MSKCKICKDIILFRWGIRHGFGECVRCGTPYKYYHYDDENNREKYFECRLKEEYVDVAQQYYQETGKRLDAEVEGFEEWLKKKGE